MRSLVNSFVEDTLGGKRSGSETAQRFLQQQIKRYDERLSAAESKLAEFKKKYVGLVPGAQGDFFSRLQAEKTRSRRPRPRSISPLNRRAGAGQPVARRAAVPDQRRARRRCGCGGTGFATPTAFKIQEAEQKLQELLLRYTDKHPDVIATRETHRPAEGAAGAGSRSDAAQRSGRPVAWPA